MDGGLHGGLRPTTNSHHLTPQPHGATRTRNTTGSKARDAAMMHDVVAVKEELERIAEQVENVE